MAVAGARRLARSLMARLQASSESLVTLRREVVQVAGHFPLGEAWTASPALAPKGNDVGRAVIQELQARFTSLMAQFEQHVDEALLAPRGGLSGLANRNGDEWRIIALLLRSKARHEINQALKSIDVARIVLGPVTESDAAQGSLDAFIESAKPRALECGGAKRLLLIMPEGPTAAQLPHMLERARHGTPTILRGSGCDLVACVEAEHIPLSGVAASLVCDDPQYAGAARRLHTRSDIEWCSLETPS
jgi:hypothetical protein